jgi:MFS family permease
VIGWNVRARAVALLGPSQLVCWGVSYYLIGILGEAIARDMAWASAVVFGGFSWALVVMGALSGVVGRAIDRFGGRPVMAAGSILTAAGCAALAAAESWAVYYLAWTVLGAAMRLTLYDAAFATLTRILGANARPDLAYHAAWWPRVERFLADRAVVPRMVGLAWRGPCLCRDCPRRDVAAARPPAARVLTGGFDDR